MDIFVDLDFYFMLYCSFNGKKRMIAIISNFLKVIIEYIHSRNEEKKLFNQTVLLFTLISYLLHNSLARLPTHSVEYL